MKRQRRFSLAILLAPVAILLSSVAGANELGSGVLRLSGSSSGSFEPPLLVVGVGPRAFLSQRLERRHIGRTFVVASDRPLQSAIDHLTNGQDDSVFFHYLIGVGPGGAGTARPESSFFTFAGFPGANGVDFAGAEISRIEVRLDAFSLVRSRGVTSIDITATVRVFGDVPVVRQRSRWGRLLDSVQQHARRWTRVSRRRARPAS